MKSKFKRLLGIDLPTEYFVHSAHSTASFIANQQPGASCFAIGTKCLTETLLSHGLKLVDEDPDYVVVGESRDYKFDDITKGINFVLKGARLIATNNDITAMDEVKCF